MCYFFHSTMLQAQAMPNSGITGLLEKKILSSGMHTHARTQARTHARTHPGPKPHNPEPTDEGVCAPFPHGSSLLF